MNHWCDVTTENTKAILGCINKTTVPRKIKKIVSIYSNRYSDWRFSREKKNNYNNRRSRRLCGLRSR